MQDVMHLLNRIGFGSRPGQIERIQQIGVDKYVEQQLEPEQPRDTSVNVANPADPPRQILFGLQAQKIVRAVHSEWQLQEVMTDFWFNHFNIFWGKNAD